MRLLLLLALACAAACAHPPGFVRKTPLLRLIYRPAEAPCPVLHPRFRCMVARRWKGPEKTPGGYVFREPKGRAVISMVFHPEGSPDWKTPTAYRQHMREQGSAEDGRVLYEVLLSSRPASRVRFTTHRYDPRYLLGERKDVFYTDLVMIADPEGIFVFRYESLKAEFARHARVFEEFLRSISFPEPGKALSRPPGTKDL